MCWGGHWNRPLWEGGGTDCYLLKRVVWERPFCVRGDKRVVWERSFCVRGDKRVVWERPFCVRGDKRVVWERPFCVRGDRQHYLMEVSVHRPVFVRGDIGTDHLCMVWHTPLFDGGEGWHKLRYSHTMGGILQQKLLATQMYLSHWG